MKKSAKLTIPMWEIDKNNKIKSYAKQIIDVSIELRTLEADIKILNDSIEIFNNRINIYLSNIFSKPNFKHGDHVIAIKEGNEAHIYKKKDVIKNGGSIKGENMNPIFKCQLNEKRVAKIMDMLHDYNELIDDFDEFIEEYEVTLNTHAELWQDVKLTLKNTQLFKVYEDIESEQSDGEIEEYNEDQHLLVIMQDKKDWNFKYIRKEDEKEFNKFVESQTKKLKKKE